jgi:hypothetical protein
MKDFNLSIDYVEFNIQTKTATHNKMPFHTKAHSYEEARNQALEHAQMIARGYNGNKTTAFFFRICNP